MTNRPDLLDDFFTFLDEASREVRAREAAYREWLGRALPAVADELTETLPPEMRAVGMRFEWTEQR